MLGESNFESFPDIVSIRISIGTEWDRVSDRELMDNFIFQVLGHFHSMG